MAVGLLGANVDYLAHGKVWYVHYTGAVHAHSILLSPVTSVSDILWPYRRSVELHVELLDTLRSHEVSFEISRKVANTWAEQPYLEDDGWDARWEELCQVEIDRWDNR
jgi:hypothetical protein